MISLAYHISDFDQIADERELVAGFNFLKAMIGPIGKERRKVNKASAALGHILLLGVFGRGAIFRGKRCYIASTPLIDAAQRIKGGHESQVGASGRSQMQVCSLRCFERKVSFSSAAVPNVHDQIGTLRLLETHIICPLTDVHPFDLRNIRVCGIDGNVFLYHRRPQLMAP